MSVPEIWSIILFIDFIVIDLLLGIVLSPTVEGKEVYCLFDCFDFSCSLFGLSVGSKYPLSSVLSVFITFYRYRSGGINAGDHSLGCRVEQSAVRLVVIVAGKPEGSLR